MSDSDNEVRTVIGQGSVLEGTLKVNHGIQVDGIFRGSVSTPISLLVSDGGEVEAEVVEVGTAEIHGTIRARNWVRFGATARIRGSVETPRLIVEEGR